MTQADFWAIPDAEIERLTADLANSRAALKEAGEALRVIDQQLTEVRQREREIATALAKTYDVAHTGGPGGILLPNVAGREARAPLFDALTDLAERFGPLRNQRRWTSALVKAYLKHITRATKLLASAEKRKARKSQKRLQKN
jgi:hypothetical protein